MNLPTKMLTIDEARAAGLKTFAGPFFISPNKDERKLIEASLADLARLYPGTDPELSKVKRSGSLEIRIVLPAEMLRESKRRKQHARIADAGAAHAARAWTRGGGRYRSA